MYKFCNLFSGSSGNCSFIKTDHLNILVDFGISYKRTCEALASIGEDISNIDAIFITHEHSDHTKGLKTLLKNHDIPIYSNKKTLSELQKQAPLKSFKLFKNNENISLEDLTITPFSIYHDAADPVAYTFQQNRKKLSLCTDLRSCRQ